MGARRWFAAASAVALVGGLSLVSLVHGAPRAYAANPGNDNFANATTIVGANGSVTVSNAGATTEAGEPSLATGSTDNWGASLWFTWTAPSDGLYLFDTCQSHIDALSKIYTGSGLSNLTPATTGDELWCTNDGGYFNPDGWELNATQGASYDIQVAGDRGQMGSVTLRWWSEQTPLNDTSGTAITLTGGTGHTTATNRFATQDSDPSFVDNGIWWVWTPPSTGTYMFDTCGSNFDTKLGVYTLSGSTWNPLVENDDACGLASQGTFAANAGTTYYIEVGGFSEDDIGDIVLNWQPDTPPANDNFSSATSLPGTVSGTATGNNRFATTEPNEPDFDSGNTVWWTWQAPATGRVIFDTCGSDIPTYLEAFTGSDLANLTLVQSDDHSCLDESRIMFNAVSGTTYSIQVDAYWEQPGDITLHWQMGDAPVNDDFGNATSLSGTAGTASVDNMFATSQTGEPLTNPAWSPDLGGHSVWWTWTAPDNTPVNFNTCGSALVDNAVAVYTGDSVDSLTAVAAGPNNICGYQGQATFTPVAGTSYHIAVDSTDSFGMGDIRLQWGPAPTAPSEFSADFSNDLVNLSWAAPAAANGAHITGYIVEYKQPDESHWYWTYVPGGTSTATSISWLGGGVTWDLRVAADTDTGTGLFSPQSTLLVPGTPAPPDAPTVTPGNGEVTVSWSAPFDGGSAITDYLVEYSAYGSETWTTVGPISNTTRSTTISGLDNGTPYYFEVAAENQYGTGTWSGVTEATPAGPPLAPGAPAVGTITTSKGTFTVPLTWTDDSDGGSIITDHLVQVYKYKAATKKSPATYSPFETLDTHSTDQSYSVTGLKSGTYAFTVAAVNAVDTGPYSPYSATASRR